MTASPSPSTSPQTDATAPDVADMRYGPYQRNVLDYWRPRTDGPAPLVINIHGGGFRAGDKKNISDGLLDTCLDAGFAFASINYRLSHQASVPAFMLDGARALQFLRAHADDLGFDPQRVALTGASAGAGISLWVGFHTDLAKPESEDPVDRQSTSVKCIGIRNGQCSYDPRLLRKLGLGAGVEHGFIEAFYGLKRSQFDTHEAYVAFESAAAITYVKPGVPPVFSFHHHSLAPVPELPPADAPDSAAARKQIIDDAIHHPRLSVHLKEQLDRVGAECVLEAGVKDTPAVIRRMVQFFQRHL
ncbi:MAG: alpha/beta hydrolase [Phycisphaeraceae bacterium]